MNLKIFKNTRPVHMCAQHLCIPLQTPRCVPPVLVALGFPRCGCSQFPRRALLINFSKAPPDTFECFVIFQWFHRFRKWQCLVALCFVDVYMVFFHFHWLLHGFHRLTFSWFSCIFPWLFLDLFNGFHDVSNFVVFWCSYFLKYALYIYIHLVFHAFLLKNAFWPFFLNIYIYRERESHS